MLKLKLEFLTEDKRKREICELYWKMDNNGKFAHKVSEITKRFNMKQHELIKMLKESCRVFDQASTCEDCGQPADYFYHRIYLPSCTWTYDKICPKCKSKRKVLGKN